AVRRGGGDNRQDVDEVEGLSRRHDQAQVHQHGEDQHDIEDAQGKLVAQQGGGGVPEQHPDQKGRQADDGRDVTCQLQGQRAAADENEEGSDEQRETQRKASPLEIEPLGRAEHEFLRSGFRLDVYGERFLMTTSTVLALSTWSFFASVMAT